MMNALKEWRHISASCIKCTRVYDGCIERMEAYHCILYKMYESVSQMHRKNGGISVHLV